MKPDKKKLIIGIVVVVVIAAVILFFVFQKRKEAKQTNVNPNDFYPLFADWLRKKEGRQDTSPEEGGIPAPGTDIYGVRGVTFKTFQSLASKLGYYPTVENFLAMRDETTPIYQKIVQYIFDKGKSYGVANPVISTYIGSWFWGTGSIYEPWETRLKQLIENYQGVNLLRKLVDLRKEFFIDLANRKPEKQKHLNGWLNRAEDFFNQFSKFV